ncbi:MAG: hypothetical protein KDA05_07760 [Phycisphaerales bacterium]|nr:hypothetical protein [Phycisphaerales bacterium]MCB9840335.1 hypothetical protein [Phycisphaeraceae bacterium]
MSRLAFGLILWVALGLELGLRPALALGPTGIAPSIVIPLVVFVAMHAPGMAAAWAAVAAGLLLDLTFPIGLEGGGEVRVPGPMAIGLLLAAAATTSIRGMLIKHNPLTVAAVSVVAALIAWLTAWALLGVRGLYGDPISFSAGPEFGRRILSSLYTGVVGGIEALVLFPIAGVFGFQSSAGPRRMVPR